MDAYFNFTTARKKTARSPFLYEKLIRSLLEEMASGTWREGQRFLSVRDIIRHWGVSRPTVCMSLEILHTKGLLTASPRKGYFLSIDFQSKAQMFLRRNRTPSIRPPLHFEQKVRILRGIRGGRIALILECKKTAPSKEFSILPSEVSPSVRGCGRAFFAEGSKQGFTVTAFLYDGSRKNADWLCRTFKDNDFEGAAVFCRSSYQMIQPILQPLLHRRLPIVIMYDDCQGLPVHSVNFNNVGLGHDAIRDFYRAGHRRITILIRKTPLKLHKMRLKGCLLARDEGGCAEARLTVLKVGSGVADNLKMTRHFIDPATRPTAIFACESRPLQQMIPLWNSLGLTVPDDLSIIVCSSRPQLTGIPVPLDTMHLKMASRVGRIAARHLRRIQDGEPLEKTTLLDVHHVRRGSVKDLEAK